MPTHGTDRHPRRSPRTPAAKPRACIYCRVSSAAQAEDDKVSLAEQLADCERYCEEHGYEVVLRYQDVMSGSTSRRPDFQRLIRDAGEGAFDVVVCWKVDRLGRGLFPMARLLEACEPNGIEIEAVKERVDQKYLGLFASVGKIELDNIRERTMGARLAYARQGKVPNGIAAYGYAVGEDGKPVFDEAEQAILLEAAERYAAGELPTAIMRDFRARSVPTRLPQKIKHQPWTKVYINRLVADEAYVTGKRTYGGETVQYPPLYSADLWRRLCERRAQNTRFARRNTREPYLLQHLLYCARCGCKYTSSTRRNGRARRPRAEGGGWYQRPLDRPVRQYRCLGSMAYDFDCRTGGHLNADRIEAEVWAEVAAALRDKGALLEGVRVRLAALEAQQPDGGGEAAQALAELQVRRLNAGRERLRGKLDEATLDALVAEIEQEEAYWRPRAEAEAGLQTDAEAQRRALRDAETYLDSLRDPDELDADERRGLLLALVDRIVVEPDGGWHLEGLLGRPLPESVLLADRAPDGTRGTSTTTLNPHAEPTWRVPFTLPAPAAAAGAGHLAAAAAAVLVRGGRRA